MNRSEAKVRARAAPILERLPAGRCVLVEVGVNRGQLAEHLLGKRQDLEWHGVDPWWHAPDHSSAAYVRTGDGHAVQTLRESDRALAQTRTRVERYRGRASIHRGASPAAAARFERDWATMVFIDADHSYEGARDDVAAWWPVVAPGGWLGGDDYDHPDPQFAFGVGRAVDEFVAAGGLALELDGPRWDFVGRTWWVRKPA